MQPLILQVKLGMHATIMNVDPRLRGLKFTYAMFNPTPKFPYSLLEFAFEGNIVRLPLKKKLTDTLTQAESSVISKLFIAMPAMMVWVNERGITGLSQFMYSHTPADAIPARESGWVMIHLMSLNGAVPA